MQKKLLVICGPTATGKTSLALSLARKFNGELISSDSRQVYKGMDIGTGKDLPEGAKLKAPSEKRGYYDFDGIPVWGLDLVEPKEDFSVAHYVKFARGLIEDIQRRGKLPILVGGTGFYIKGVIDGIDTLDVPQNKKLRATLQALNVVELFTRLLEVDKKKALSLNESDRKNPPRIVRAIEVALWRQEAPPNKAYATMGRRVSRVPQIPRASVLFIGLTAPKEVLHKRIEERVQKRVVQGVEKEIKGLLRHGITWEMKSMNTLGYKEWREYWSGTKTKDEIIEKWIRDEKIYAKRQLTWFQKDTRINWFDVTAQKSPEMVEKMIKSWHTLHNG